MALATLTLTTNGKCIDFHRNAAEIRGVGSGDEYIWVDSFLRMTILTDGVEFTLTDDSKIYLPYDQVETVGGTTHIGGFPDSATLKDALKILLNL